MPLLAGHVAALRGGLAPLDGLAISVFAAGLVVLAAWRHVRRAAGRHAVGADEELEPPKGLSSPVLSAIRARGLSAAIKPPTPCRSRESSRSPKSRERMQSGGADVDDKPLMSPSNDPEIAELD